MKRGDAIISDNPKNSYVVKLPNQIITIPQDSHIAWLPLFYALPKELVIKWKDYLNIPRNPYDVLYTDKYNHLINDDVFLQLIWESYAWSVWQFIQVPRRDGYGNMHKHLREVLAYIREDVEGFREEWIAQKELEKGKSIGAEKKKLEQTRKRINEIDFLMQKLYEDMAFGIMSKERYEKFAKNYEEEQKKLEKDFSVMQAQVEKAEAVISNIDSFLSLVEKYVDIPELTPKIINDFIKKIVVFEAEKIDGKRYQRVYIFFNFVDEIDIPASFSLDIPLIKAKYAVLCHGLDLAS